MQGELLDGEALYKRVIQQRVAAAKKSVWIATANVKAMLIERGGRYRPLVDLFSDLEKRGVGLRLLHAELPSRPFRKFFDRKKRLVEGGLELRLCPRVHFKCVIVDGTWVYFGSANLTGAGLGAKSGARRNFELGVVSEDFDAVDRVTAMFESVWSGVECANCGLYKQCGDPIGPGPQKVTRKGSDVRLGRARRYPKVG